MQPNATSAIAETGVQPRKEGAFDRYLTYCALGGLMVSDDGNISTMTLEQFCDEEGIDRATTWRWKKNVANFVALVRERRNEIVPLARETAALNRLFVLGMSSLGSKPAHKDQRAAVDALRTYLGHHSALKLPTQPHEIEPGGGFADLLNLARKRRDDHSSLPEPIEGQIVSEPNPNA